MRSILLGLIEFLGRDYLGTYTGWRVNPINLTFGVNIGLSLNELFVFEIGRQKIDVSSMSYTAFYIYVPE